jgi:hypothetical protein
VNDASLCASVADYFAGGDGVARDDVREHLGSCVDCAAHFVDDRRLLDALSAPPPAVAPRFLPPVEVARSPGSGWIAAGLLIVLLGAGIMAARAARRTPPDIVEDAGSAAPSDRVPSDAAAESGAFRTIGLRPTAMIETVVSDLADGTALVTRRVFDVDVERRGLGEQR